MHATRVLRLGGISLLPLAMSGPTPVRLLRTTTRRRSSQPPPQQPQPKNPNLMPSAVPLLHRPGSFTILTLLRYTTSMLPILFAISVPGINDEYGYALTSLFAASSLIPAGFIRWYSAPYVYVAQLELPQNLRGREAVKAWVKHGDIRDANLRLRRIGGRWEQVRIGDLQRKEERAKCVDTIEKVGKVRRFYFGEGPGKVREGWMLGEILRRIGEISGKGN